MATPVVNEIMRKIERLPANLQRQVLSYVDNLQTSEKRGKAGKQLLQFAGSIPDQDLAQIQDAIAAGCEQVNIDDLQIQTHRQTR